MNARNSKRWPTRANSLAPLRVTATYSQSWDGLELSTETLRQELFYDGRSRSQIYQEQRQQALNRFDDPHPNPDWEQELFGLFYQAPIIKNGYVIIKGKYHTDVIHINNRYHYRRGDIIGELHQDTCQLNANKKRNLLALHNDLIHQIDKGSGPHPNDEDFNSAYRTHARRVDPQVKVFLNRNPTLHDFLTLTPGKAPVWNTACRIHRSPLEILLKVVDGVKEAA